MAAQTLLSFGLAIAVILLLIFRFDIDLGQTWESIRNANPLLYASALAAYYIAFLFRGLRWRILVENSGVQKAAGERVPSVLQCAEGILLGWFVNSLTWFRLGDAYRGYLMNQYSGLKFSKSLGTVLAERVVDIFIMFALLVISAFAFLGGKNSRDALLILIAAAGLLLAAVFVVLVMKFLGPRLIRWLPHRVQTWYHQFHEGALESLRQQMPALVIVSVMAWLVDSSRLLLVIYALDLSGAIDLSLGHMLLFVLFAALAHSLLTTIPFTPGGLGFVEVGLTSILAIEMSRSDALGVALVERSITYVSILVFGMLIFLSREIRRRRALVASPVKPGGTGG